MFEEAGFVVVDGDVAAAGNDCDCEESVGINEDFGEFTDEIAMYEDFGELTEEKLGELTDEKPDM